MGGKIRSWGLKWFVQGYTARAKVWSPQSLQASAPLTKNLGIHWVCVKPDAEYTEYEDYVNQTHKIEL